MTTTISSVCPKCGIIAKSGKISCCGHSGSWFGNCGSAGNVKLDHTWYAGIHACKTLSQPKAAIGRRSNANEHGMANHKKSFHLFTFMFTNTSSPMLVSMPSVMTLTHHVRQDNQHANSHVNCHHFSKRVSDRSSVHQSPDHYCGYHYRYD